MVFRWFATSCVLAGFVFQVAAETIGTEDFSYANAPIDGLQGGTGWDWNELTGTHTGSVSDWDLIWGNVSVQEGEVLTSNGGALREYNGPTVGVGGDEGLGAIRNSGVVFYQVTMRRGVSGVWGGISTYDFGQERIFFGVPGFLAGNNQLGIEEPGAGSTASGISLTTGQSYQLIAVLDFDNQLAGLFVDPDSMDSWSPSGGTADIKRTYTGGNWSTSVRLGSGGDVYWDDLKVVDDWADLDFGEPVVVDDQATMRHFQKARILVLDNDEGEISPSSVIITASPTSGSVSVSPDGSIVYEHTSGSPVSDQFSYRVSNSAGDASLPGTVVIDFSTAERFETNYVKLPQSPPSSLISIVDAFPGLNFDTPHGFCGIPGGGGKLLVTESAGRLFMVPNVGASPTNANKIQILDLTSQITVVGERALKGVAAHPDWANNGYIYVTYDHSGGTVRLSRFTCLTSAPYTASSELVLIDQVSQDNIHSIATPHFGADGYLYVGFGDEGTQDDGWDNSQQIDKDLYSCVIRIDVDKKASNLIPNPDSDIPRVSGGSSGEANYRVPADNPFVGATSFNGISLNPMDVRTEIVVAGVRNPWQFSPEDRDGNGTVDELWIGDVGRADTEELNVFQFGDNGGWAWREGSQAGIRSGQLINGAAESAATLSDPYWEYGHGGGAFVGNSITAGFFYQGTSIPSLTGHYILGDFAAGNVWAVDPNVAMPAPGAGIQRLGGDAQIVGFEPDPETGDILILSRGGGIKRVVAQATDQGFPGSLSETNFFSDLSDLTANPGGHDYTPNLRFWSDHAEKKRWFLIQDEIATMGFSATDSWSYPAGMIWAKHFDYPTEWETFTRSINGQKFTDRRPVASSPRTRLETRFLVRNSAGAYGVSYRWNNQNGGTQNDAALANSNGESIPVDVLIDGSPTTVSWNIPSRSACMVCHTPQAGHALSFNTRQLNLQGSLNGVTGNFLDRLQVAGYVTGFVGDASEHERHVTPSDDEYSLEARVRSYLDVNCAYCHKDGGTGGGDWDGRYHLTLDEAGLVNADPSDAPLNLGDLLVKPEAVNQSILYSRIAGTNGYTRMPPLASDVVDLEGAQLVADWIASEVQPYVSYDEWRMAHFGNLTSPEGEKAANPDGDARTNEFEWTTNTDPLDGASHWQAQIELVNGNVNIDYFALGNRSVRVLHSSDLITWDYWDVPMNDGLPRNPATIQELSGPALEERGFFRFELNER